MPGLKISQYPNAFPLVNFSWSQTPWPTNTAILTPVSGVVMVNVMYLMQLTVQRWLFMLLNDKHDGYQMINFMSYDSIEEYWFLLTIQPFLLRSYSQKMSSIESIELA